MLASEPRETPARSLSVQSVSPSPDGPEPLPGGRSCSDPLLQAAPCLPGGDAGRWAELTGSKYVCKQFNSFLCCPVPNTSPCREVQGDYSYLPATHAASSLTSLLCCRGAQTSPKHNRRLSMLRVVDRRRALCLETWSALRLPSHAQCHCGATAHGCTLSLTSSDIL